MDVLQLSVFVENKAGRAEAVTSVLENAGVNVRGFSIADTVDYGITRFITDKPEAGLAALREAGYAVIAAPILVLKLADTPGELARVLGVIARAGVSIQYAYSLISTFIAVQVADIEAAKALLADEPVTIIDQETLAGYATKED